MMNKRGVTVQSMLIGIIIVLLTAAILFFFFRALPYKETVDKEACHQSAILRNNMFLKGEFGPQIPLNCKTQEIKISSTNEGFIKREIANAMYDCWWMLGEGKLNFFKRDPTLKDINYCVICSTIEFSENTQKYFPKIKGLDTYLSSTNIPTKNITYWTYFYTEAPIVIKDEKEVLSIDTERKYAIIYSHVTRSTLVATGYGAVSAFGLVKAGAAIGTIIAPGVGTVVGGVLGFAIGAVGGFMAGDKIDSYIRQFPGDYYVVFSLVPLEADAIQNFGCQHIESIP